jgi:hypothetical protein
MSWTFFYVLYCYFLPFCLLRSSFFLVLLLLMQFADETHHRDVNHTFAEMDSQAPSPFAMQSKRDALRAFELDATGQTAWPSVAETEAAAASRAAAKMTAAVAAADLVNSKKK